jgi:hypothetical protein
MTNGRVQGHYDGAASAALVCGGEAADRSGVVGTHEMVPQLAEQVEHIVQTIQRAGVAIMIAPQSDAQSVAGDAVSQLNRACDRP